MRFLKLRFENINSLKGKHEIDFTANPLAEAGLFAITGPTGAGKSSILDAITLALFNRVPRLSTGNKTLSTSDIEELGAIITHGETSAFAEVEYDTNGKSYLSKWSISSTRFGSLRDYEMEIAELPAQTILDLKKRDVPSKNEELIGLSYDQFIKSVLLSQGDFARFLKSTEKERSKLLEQITGTEIYRLIGQRAYEKNKSYKDEIKNLENLLENISIPSEEQITEVQKKLKEVTDTLVKSEKEFQIKNTLLETKRQIHQLSNKLDQLIKDEEKLQTEKEKFKPQLKKLELHRKALTLSSRINEVETMRKRIDELGRSIEENKKNLEKDEKKKSQLILEASKETRQELNQENFSEVIEKLRKKWNGFSNQINANKEKQGSSKKRIEDIYKKLPDNEKKMPKVAEDVPQYLRERVNVLDEQLKGLAVPKGLTVKNVAEKVKQIYEYQSKLGYLKKTLKERNELGLKLTQAGFKIKTLQKTMATITEDSSKLQNAIDLLNEELEIKESELALEQKKAGLDDLRNELKANEPCPLCGSKEHPYVKHYKNKEPEIKIRIKQLKEKLKEKQAEQKQLGDKNTKAKTEIDFSKKISSEAKIKLSNIKSNLEKTKKELNVYYSEDEKTISGYEISLKQEGEQIQLWKEKMVIKELLNDLKNEYESYLKSKKSEAQLRKSQEEIYKGEDADNVFAKWIRQFDVLVNEIKNHRGKIKEATNDKKLLEDKIKESEGVLKNEIIQAGFISETDAKAAILSNKEADTIENQHSHLKEQTVKFSTQKTETETLLASTRQKDDVSVSLESLEGIVTNLKSNCDNLKETKGEINNQLKILSENKVKYQSSQKELEQKRKDASKWQIINELIGDAKGDRFSSIAQEMTVRQLIVLANIRLQQLTDRYLLDKSRTDTAHIEVIDCYIGNTRRAVSTLSGGETFLVSLALALGLSDLASEKVHLDSLFIDEGFGALDPETLDTAISTLERLQAESNKMIGVISHIEALTDRIGCQIKVFRVGSGYSKIEVIGYPYQLSQRC